MLLSLAMSKGKARLGIRNMRRTKKAILKDFYRHQDARGRYRVGDLTGPETRTGESGEPWRDFDPTAIGRHWAVPRTGEYAKYIEEHLYSKLQANFRHT